MSTDKVTAPAVSDSTTSATEQASTPALDWNSFGDDDDTGITTGTQSAEVPKACSLENPECESCQ